MMLEFARFKIDPANQCVWRTGDGVDEQIPLAPKAFSLLQYLVENRGRLVSHDELLDTLWPDVVVQPEVIKSQILAIRNALGADAHDGHFIQAVRKRGYKFVGDVADRRSAAVAIATNVVDSPYVGREVPMAELQYAFNHAERADRQITFIVGEPGIGKTALVEHFIGALQSDALLAIGRCVEGFGGTEPHFPVLEALSHIARAGDDKVVQSIVSIAPTWAVQLTRVVSPETRGRLTKELAGSTRQRMVREFCDLVEVLATHRPLVLVLEDLHWSDYSTIDLLSALARRAGPAKLMVIATYRLGDAIERSHPVRDVSLNLGSARLCSEIALGPLDPWAVREFVAGEEGSQDAQDLAQIIAGQSGGIPLFMHASLDNLAERGLIGQGASGWRPNVSPRDIRFTVTGKLAQTIEARIAQLDGVQTEVLEAASVVGNSFHAPIAYRASGLDALVFEEVCETLVRRQKCIERGDLCRFPDGTVAQTYTFKHALYRQAFYSRLGPIRLQQSHHRAAAALEAKYPGESRSEVAVQLVRHFAGANLWERALENLRVALQVATGRFASRDAISILDQSLSIAGQLQGDARYRAEVELLEHKAVLYGISTDSRSIDCYAELVEKASRNNDVSVKAKALFGLGYITGWIDRDRFVVISNEAIAFSEKIADPEERAAMRVALYTHRIYVLGWNPADTARCEDALAVLQRGSNAVWSARAMIDNFFICMTSARYREAIERFQISYDYLFDNHRSSSDDFLTRAVWKKIAAMAFAFLYLGDIGRAAHVLESNLEIAIRGGNVKSARRIFGYQGLIKCHMMDFEGARDDCERVLHDANWSSDGGQTSDIDLPPTDWRLRSILAAFAEVGLGNHYTGLKSLLEIERRIEEQPLVLDWYYRSWLDWGLVNALLGVGDLSAAQSHAKKFVAGAEQTEERTWRALALDARARVELALGAPHSAIDFVERAIETMRGYETPLADWRVHQTAAIAYEALGESYLQTKHSRLSKTTRAKLSASLPKGHRLRATFEAGTAFTPMMGGRASN
jgi:DNA-binding winged helix-turn-helix (wHTH) protein/tetratricopeptide (TPR) repeat protein